MSKDEQTLVGETTAEDAAPTMGRRPSALRGILDLVLSAKMIPVLKSTLAFTISLVLIVLRDFDELSPFPPALISMLIVTIAGNAGGTIGASIVGATLALAGVGAGGLGFYILAHLHNEPVAQGAVLFVFIYFATLLKAQSMVFFGASLFSILVAFNGIYTSILLGGYDRGYLIAYLEAYCWGAAISLFVNFFIWPTSAEKQLRRTLVLSLEHVGTLGHLLSKTYTMTITEEEREARDRLAQTLRADFGFLTQKIAETVLEINWSKYSMADYSEFVLRTRALQLAAISAHSSLLGLADGDMELFKKYFLPNTAQPLHVFRRCVDNTVKDISLALESKSLKAAEAQPEYRQFVDVEAQKKAEVHSHSNDAAALGEELQRVEQDVEQQLELVSRRLESEVDHTDVLTARVSPSSPAAKTSSDGVRRPGAFEVSDPENSCKQSAGGPDCNYGVEKVVPLWNKFALTQQHILSELLATGVLHGQDDKLRMHLPQPSIRAAWSGARTPRETIGPLSRPQSHAPSIIDGTLEDDDDSIRIDEDAETRVTHHSLLRVYSFILAVRVYVEQLEAYHQAAVKFTAGKSNGPSRRLQVHFFQQLHKPWDNTMRRFLRGGLAMKPESAASLQDATRELGFDEAMALLENRDYVPKTMTMWQRFKALEDAIRSPTSIFALKSAAGAVVFSVLLLAHGSRQWFINYGIQSGLLTLIVAISPTLGQTVLGMFLQVSGSGIGYLWGVALLEMFRDVGGYKFNPYGMISLLAASAVPFFYLIYYVPRMFVFSLLALNSAGVLICMEWMYTTYYHRSYDTPIYRAGKLVAGLAIAMGIALLFQFFVLRNPARRTLRKSMANLTFSMLSYYTLFQAWLKVVVPMELDGDAPHPPTAALVRINEELHKRELKLQQDIIAMGPLLVFAGAERDFGPAFNPGPPTKIIQSLQLMLDRLKEARYTVGTTRVPGIITREFSQRLAPYRQRTVAMTKSSLLTCASSLASKAPLPSESLAKIYLESNRNDNLHDALLISSHLSRTTEGREAIMNGELTRYFACVMTLSGVTDQLLVLEKACHDLFGDIDSRLS
ncbi:hypothetical protein BKA62DRAFT_446468 [Auriculariales sp. MPI-PUGE-AT-0066]|nr:hypothetical protein BKA62DRAFT_446468 [Auriculariales sp. MPI-PUGE-AT-0066]